MRKGNGMERLINRLKPFHWVATHFETVAVSYFTVVTIPAIQIWLQAYNQAIAAATTNRGIETQM